MKFRFDKAQRLSELVPRWLERRDIFFPVILIITAILFLSALVLLPPSKTWTTITADSQSISYVASISEYSTFRVAGMRARTGDGMDSCVDGFVQPAAGSRVEYRGANKASLRIIVESLNGSGVASLIPVAGGAAQEVPSTILFIADSTCLGSVPDLLPIWGAIKLGEPVRPTGSTGDLMPGLLLSGEVVVFARAHESFLGIKFPSLIYRVTSFTLPSASSIRGFWSSREEAIWRGVATLHKEGSALHVMLAGQPSKMEISVPGDSGDRAVGTIDMGSYSEFLKDPNLITIQAIFAIFLYISKLVYDAVARLRRQKQDLQSP